LPARGAARRQRLKSLEQESRTLVIYESPHRVRETLEDCLTAFGETRAATVVREATKLHETTYRGSLLELLHRSKSDADFARGEIVLLIGGAQMPASGDADSDATAALDKVLAALLVELPLKQAARLAAQITGARDNEAYKRALLLKQQSASH
jgi:16S rRNA (cytidine1402-2'-O)-methyltransferase